MFGSIFDGDAHAEADLVLRLALAVGAAALLLTVGLVLQVLLLRWRSSRRRALQARVVKRWRPLLLAIAHGEEVQVPRLPRRERQALLELWNQLQESLRGSAHQALVGLALALGLDQLARRAVASGNGKQRVLGLRTLAHIGAEADSALLLRLLDDPHWFLGMAAARALLRIDAGRTAPYVVECYLTRPDWPLPRMGTLLRESGAHAAAPVVAHRLRNGTPEEQIRLLPLAPTLFTGFGLGEEQGVVEATLASASDERVLVAALAQVQGPQALQRVRSLIGHPVWQVRANAASALGRVGQPADRDRLVAMLSDPQWWVRYRAAQALLSLPGSDMPRIVALVAGLTDRYARDIMAQATAERLLMPARR